MYGSHIVKTSSISIGSIFIYKAKVNFDGIGGYHGLVDRANIGNRENTHASVSEKKARVAFKYHHIILKLPGEYKQDL